MFRLLALRRRQRLLLLAAVVIAFYGAWRWFNHEGKEPPNLNVPCTLPALDPFHSSVLPFVNPVQHIQCNSSSYPLLFDVVLEKDGSGADELILLQPPQPLGYSDCCYKHFKMGRSDTEQVFSEECHRLDTHNAKRWRIDHDYDYIAVYCRRDGVLWNALKGLAMGDDRTLVDMFNFAHTKPQRQPTTRPTEHSSLRKPSVLLLGLDSVSRMNQIRTMPASRQLLQELGAVEFLGHNLVEENTFTNIIPILTGYNEKELKSVCWHDAETHFDSCPFIWKNYSRAGYLTSYGEDASNYGNFLYNKVGFKLQPTDFYTIPLVNAMEGHGLYHAGDGPSGDYVCYGPRLGWEVIFSNVRKVAAGARQSGRPFFQFTWATSLTHSDNNYPAAADGHLVELLSWLRDGSYLNETIVILLSDHGSREGGLRQTEQGAIEARMPFVWFLLPDWFQREYSVAVGNLRRNAETRTTPYDVHEVLVDLLDMGRIKDGAVLKRKESARGLSLFTPLPNPRSCYAAGILFHSCACAAPVPLSTEDSSVVEATRAAVEEINKKLSAHPQCAVLVLERIRTAHQLYKGTGQVLRVSFETTPSRAIFEATMLQESSGWTVVGGVSRLNLYGKQSECVHEYKLKNLCYCT